MANVVISQKNGNTLFSERQSDGSRKKKKKRKDEGQNISERVIYGAAAGFD